MSEPIKTVSKLPTHPDLRKLAQQFHELFQGQEGAYGTYQASTKNGAGKLGGKAVTIPGSPVTTELWEAHLTGRQRLGIIPINEQSRCKFGAIDVDDYPVDHLKLRQKVTKLGLPLNVFRSKSGGAHLFLILTEFIPAGRMQDTLKSYCAALGLGVREIFPKQRQIDVLNGDTGNWINMPAFGYALLNLFAKTTTALLSTDGAWVSIDQFFANVLVVKPDQAKEHDLGSKGSRLIAGGPPCLQTLAASGFPEGTRNNGLVALATYAKKAHPKEWQEKVREYGKTLMKPSMGEDEIASVISSLEKTNYTYKCHDQPLNMYCNPAVCRTRKFGIGNSDTLPIVSNATMISEEDGGATWLLEVMDDSNEPRKVKVTDKHLTDQREFRRLMLSQRICAMPTVKTPAFEAFVASIHRMAKDTPILMPFESTAAGQFKNYLCEFVELKHTEDPGDVRAGMVYHCAKDQEVRFRLADLTQWLDVRKRWTVWDRRAILIAVTQTYQARSLRLSDPGRSYGYAIKFSVLGINPAPERLTEDAGASL